jgi:hypothetical protein
MKIYKNTLFYNLTRPMLFFDFFELSMVHQKHFLIISLIETGIHLLLHI